MNFGKVHRIAIVGSHGVGKTTLALRIATEYKKAGHNAIVVQESARECPFRINEGQSHEATLWIALNHCLKELNGLQRGYNVVVCDRSAFDSVVYDGMTDDCCKMVPHMSRFRDFCLDWLKGYNQVIFVEADDVLSNSIGDAVRSTNEDFRRKIDRRYQYIINQIADELGDRLTRLQFSSIRDIDLNIQSNRNVLCSVGQSSCLPS